MTDIAKLGIEVDSTQVVKADKDLDNFAMAAKNADKAAEDFSDELKKGAPQAKKFGKAANDASKSMGGVGRNAGMAGIQVQQFVGQIQGGQSAIVAFSQQSADLGFVLGMPMVGVVVSLAAVLGGVLLPMFMSAAKSAAEVTEEIEKLNESMETLGDLQRAHLIDVTTKAIEEQAKATEKLKEEYLDVEQTLIGLTDSFNRNKRSLDSTLMSDSQKAVALQGLTNQIDDTTEEMKLLAIEIETGGQKTGLLTDKIAKLNGEYVDLKKNTEEAAAAQLKINGLYESFSMGLERRLMLSTEITEVEKVLFEIEKGRLQGVDASQQAKLLLLADELDMHKQLKAEINALDEAEKSADKAAAALAAEEMTRNKALAATLEDNLAQALMGGANQGFMQILDGFANMLLQMAAQAVAADIIGGLFPQGGSGTNNTGSLVDSAISLGSSFAGFFDSGGNIPAGQFGIAGESGPEIIQGPANVTSTKDTAAMGGTSIGNVTMSFPGVGNANEARIAAGQAARELNKITSGAARFS